jgi:hypothetical protein
MDDSVLARIAKILFIIGVAPCVLLGFIASFLVPQGTFEEWLVFGMGFSSYATLFLSVVAGFLVGGILAAPFWIAARVQDARSAKARRETVAT